MRFPGNITGRSDPHPPKPDTQRETEQKFQQLLLSMP